MFAMGFASLLMGQAKPIPEIDWNNLPYQREVRRMADSWRAKYHLPGVWVALIKDGKVVACVATGVKNIETGAPALVTDHLNVGSVSKVITGMMIAQFVAKGVISYEMTVGQVFPELAAKYPDSPFARATLGQLMTHTAGITAKTRFDTKDEPDGVRWRRKHVVAALASDQTVEPGTRYEYTIGAVIAVAMVERQLERSSFSEWGRSYEEWLDKTPGKAIGLTNPRMKNYAAVPGPSDVQPHYLDEHGSRANLNVLSDNFIFATSGSCSVTLTDISSFALSTIFNSANLPPSIYRSTTQFQSGKVTQASWGGNDQRYLSKGGSTGRGEVCNLWVSCARRAALFFYTNTNIPPPDGDKFFGKLTPGLDEDLGRLRLLIAPMGR